MKAKSRSVPQIIEEQIHRWQLLKKEDRVEKSGVSIITISREPGSGGRVVAERLTERMGFDLFDHEVLHGMAKSADVSDKILETLDERGLSILEDWISSLVHQRHLWPDRYLHHLLKVIGAVGKHGRAVIVGRGANFILPPENCCRVRIVAPPEQRIAAVSRTFNVTPEEARRHVIRTESDRRAFIRKYFNADITNPANYDIVINMEAVTIDTAVQTILAAAGLG